MEEPPALAPYVVTGSHLPIATETAPVPLTVIDSDELDLWGDESPIQALRKQPFSFGAANTENASNGDSGSAGLNLRGLGNLSTLTLINGRRAGGNSAFGGQHGGFADLNLIPSAAIREIQIVTDGTSVAYGSDAVAGTVNLLLHDTFTGNRVDSSYSNTTDGDASEKVFSFLTGQDLSDKTHLVLMGSWYQRNAIYARDRAISKNTDFTSQGGQNQGSLSFPGRIKVDATEYVLIDPSATPSALSDYRPLDSSTDRFNFNEYAPAIPSIERSSAMANVSHEISDSLELWGEFMYTESSFDNEGAPAPWSLSSATGASSPHAPDLAGGTLTGLRYRSFELGNLTLTQEKEALRGLLGLRGKIGEWDWETAAMYIETNLDVDWSGIADAGAITTAIIDGSFNPFAPAYASGATSGGVYDNEKALKQAATNASERFEETFHSEDLKIGGPLFELPAGEVKALLGLEFRSETVDVSVDQAILDGNTLGKLVGALPFSAERDVVSIFAESLIPLIRANGNHATHPFLDLQLGLRYEGYKDSSGGLNNDYNALVYKAGLTCRPTDSITIRGNYGTAFRAPTLAESFSSEWGSLVYDDTTGSTLPYERVFTQYGANSELDPEESRTLNLGITFEPKPNEGVRASIEYYYIQTKNVISTNGQALVDMNTPGAVFRNPDDTLWFVFAQRFNAAKLRTDGLEYELSYRQPTSEGSWEASVGLNQILSYEIQARSGDPYTSYLGRLVHPLVGGGSVTGPGSIPRYKGYARLTWNYGNITLGGTLNYIHSLDDNPSATDGNEARTIDSWASLDLLAAYVWPEPANDWLRNTRLIVGIENATDEMPPFAAGAFADGYDSSLYSLEGRRISLSVSREF